ncbi:STAS/SEC14 domain-containing protein [Sulfuriferula thiophila]|uniref:STAS/SEC14 domain-containing protein n=1 Tax=Sulfuriferula thiophila TaxID=1781211 RepID=UPI000F6121E8|nr:STAS/SEC14 domain-containing protein [Sulfuriferula thiophila]
MINITTENNIVRAAALGEFTIADFHEFEETILHGIKFQGTVNLQIDLRDMLDFTIDVAWEELRFSRVHANDFGKIAIITSSEWISWSAWINQLFVEADIMVFDTLEPAESWLKQA